MTLLKINEMFATIQGEGRWAGTPATFIRTQGCPVGCPWCDTKHTWPESDRKRVTIDAMLAKPDSSPTWANMTETLIVDQAKRWKPRHFVITGGEPCAQDIYELTVQLGRLGRVQLETSGTYPITVSTDTWVTCSPKIDMPGGLEVLVQALDRANEIKLPIEDEADLEKFLEVADGIEDLDARMVLQPVSLDPDATALCIATCRDRNWRLSIQTHKLANIR